MSASEGVYVCNPQPLPQNNRYIAARADAPERRRHLLYERALKALPGSYKVRETDRERGTEGERWVCVVGRHAGDREGHESATHQGVVVTMGTVVDRGQPRGWGWVGGWGDVHC